MEITHATNESIDTVVRPLFELQHTALIVTDIERAICFFRDILGLEVAFEKPAELIRSNRPLEIAFLRSGASLLELIGPKLSGKESQCSAPRADNSAFKQMPVDHIAFVVDDLLETARYFESKSIPVIRKLDKSGALKAVSISDPDGHSVELIARVNSSSLTAGNSQKQE